MVNLASRVRFIRALQSRPFALLWLGQTISVLGDGAFDIALAWQVLLLTGSGTAMGIVLTARMVPNLVFLLIGGAAADRLPRRLVLLWSDGGRAVVVLLIAALGWLHLLQFWHLVVLSLIFGVVDGFFRPTCMAIFPQLVKADDLSSANSLTALSEQISLLLGPLLGAVYIALAGPASAFAFDGLSFIISALCLLAMRLPATTPQMLSEEAISISKNTSKEYSDAGVPLAGTDTSLAPRRSGMLSAAANVLKDVREGLRYVASSRWFLVGLPLATIGNIGAVATVVAMPKLVHDVYEAWAWLLGVLGAADAAGAIIAALLVGQAHRLHRRGLLMYPALILASAAWIVLGLPLPHDSAPLIASIANAFAGFGLGVFGVLWITVMQELVPGDMLGRVTSIDILGAKCMAPVGYLLGGVLTDRIGPSWVFIAGGLLNLLLAVIALCVRDIRRLE